MAEFRRTPLSDEEIARRLRERAARARDRALAAQEGFEGSADPIGSYHNDFGIVYEGNASTRPLRGRIT